MSLIDQIRKISFVFFLIVGLLHFLTGLLYINGYFVPTSGLINRVLFIPLVVATIAYSGATIKQHLSEIGKDSKTWTIALVSFGGLVFAGLLVIELLVVDSPCPLLPHC